MYSAVLMLAMTTGAESIDHGRRNCHSNCCSGYVGCCYSSSYGCCSGGGNYRAGSSGYGPGPYYGGSMPYYSSGPTMAQGPNTTTRQSNYFDPNQQMGARVRVIVPDADAQVWFDNTPTKQRGMDRMFESAPLDPNSKYTYTVKARWTQDGRTVDRQQEVNVRPGQPVMVDFRRNTGESLAPPKKTTEENP